ncbi:BatD family protein [Tamlana sp. 2_MG-2023]|uniref:BatD family protein n=1 Tax=unclassified Tamlana TaxID=2614803 RepID=UPI0026E3D302|nr:MULTISPECIES: BatD family protein [unclassified Tamlana]MDO6761397.1 BatD family protein [Tamlana sp. 2_MG-2023]MDO6791989.1 BatD family protein [Tamlana sp. 1_MG-2023]
MVRKVGLHIVFCLLSVACFSQNLISYVTTSTNEAYIGQPIHLTVSVYSETWFTSGIDLGNIQVDGALTVYFRSVSNSRTFSGKNYAGVNFYYNVFPTKQGEITIPSLSIHVESPKPGGYKGIKRIVKTKPKTIQVKDVPLGYSLNNWLVSNSLSINQKWSIPLKDIKVGDVVQRTISRSASGTVSEFIPATTWDSIPGVSIYPKRPSVNTHKSKTAVSATRSETVSYLFEKEGDVMIPSIEFVYWNPSSKRFYRKQIDSIMVSVKPNADLTMLASIKKSLQDEVVEEAEAEDKPFLILGLTPKVFVEYLISGLLLLFVLFKLLKYTLAVYQRKHTVYLKSEAYAFSQVKKTLRHKNYYGFISTSHIWINKLDPDFESLQDLEEHPSFQKTKEIIGDINDKAFNNQVKNLNYSQLLTHLISDRKAFLKYQKTKVNAATKNKKWLNPTATD